MFREYIPCPFPYFPIPYGCFCGITINKPDKPPIDEFDATCLVHDECYDEGIVEGCSVFDEYVWNYDWEMKNGTVR